MLRVLYTLQPLNFMVKHELHHTFSYGLLPQFVVDNLLLVFGKMLAKA